jgi:hypothetical protein
MAETALDRHSCDGASCALRMFAKGHARQFARLATRWAIALRLAKVRATPALSRIASPEVDGFETLSSVDTLAPLY